MSNVDIKIGCSQYDHVRPLFDGSVTIDGADTTFEDAPIVSQLFERMIKQRAFDVSELGLTFYLRTLASDDPPFIALPIFPNRAFRHSAIYINTDSGITKPEDLAGKTIGELGTYGHDAGVWPKGILQDEYSVAPDQCRWIIGGVDQYWPPFGFVPFIRPDNVDIDTTPEGKALGPMLEAGEVDAVISALTPQCVLNHSPHVGQLFPNYETVERDYFQRSGIFPIMHTVVIRRELAQQRPELLGAIYRAFSESKNRVQEQYRKSRMEQHGHFMIPWMSPLFDENERLLPHDWWPYGLEANRHAIDTYLRYFHQQGLSKKRFSCEEIFVPELLDT